MIRIEKVMSKSGRDHYGNHSVALMMAKTLGAALGIPQSTLDADFIPSAGGKVVPAAVTSVPA
jgi:hypothetical protein